jgi:hypothetical protein
MSLMRRIFEGKAVKDGIPGDALVVAIHAPTTTAGHHQMNSELSIRAPHRAEYQVSCTLYVKETKWPMPGMTVPVVIDRNEDSHVQVLWDEVPERARKEIQEALTAELQAGRIRARHSIESEANPDDPPELYELFDDSSEGRANYIVELVEAAGLQE